MLEVVGVLVAAALSLRRNGVTATGGRATSATDHTFFAPDGRDSIAHWEPNQGTDQWSRRAPVASRKAILNLMANSRTPSRCASRR